jgi:hypothetical protein
VVITSTTSSTGAGRALRHASGIEPHGAATMAWGRAVSVTCGSGFGAGADRQLRFRPCCDRGARQQQAWLKARVGPGARGEVASAGRGRRAPDSRRPALAGHPFAGWTPMRAERRAELGRAPQAGPG